MVEGVTFLSAYAWNSVSLSCAVNNEGCNRFTCSLPNLYFGCCVRVFTNSRRFYKCTRYVQYGESGKIEFKQKFHNHHRFFRNMQKQTGIRFLRQ